jgi:hypothetical protein
LNLRRTRQQGAAICAPTPPKREAESQTPMSKRQKKFNVPNFKFGQSVLIWSFFGVWNLAFGVS